MLAAVGIASNLVRDGTFFVLTVDEMDAQAASAHLRQYELESRPAPPPPPPPRLHPYAWIGSLGYGLVLLAVAFANSAGAWRLDAFDVGELHGARVRSGQWWRIWTALTLHVDGPHLGANLAAGVWFGYLAGRLLGAGRAWALVVIGAGAANWTEAQFGPPEHRAVGASTAVFTALGLLAAYSWAYSWLQARRTGIRAGVSWAYRWGPLVAGVVLLGWTGSEGEETDLVGHALGFVVGAILGAGICAPLAARSLERIPQWAAGLFALSVVTAAWARALVS